MTAGSPGKPATAPDAEAKLGDRIYQALRWSLIVGELEPGDTVSTRTLAAEHGVSVMPVREALKRLEAEKALTGAAKRAYRVADMTPARAADLFQIRSVLEGAAAEVAATRLPDAQIERLRELTRQMERATASADARSYLACNFTFHFIIYSGAGNPDLAAIVEALYARTGPWLSRAIRRFARIGDWENHHMRIVDAIAARDASEARRLMEVDILWSAELYRRIAPQRGPAVSAPARSGGVLSGAGTRPKI
jgi:DNA-binding GntR family transcriptional regulator